MSNNQELNNFIAGLSQGRFTTDQLSVEAQEQVMYEACRVARQVIHVNTCTNGLASIQSNAINVVAELSAQEKDIITRMPHSAARIGMLVDQFTYRTDQRLKRLGGQ